MVTSFVPVHCGEVQYEPLSLPENRPISHPVSESAKRHLGFDPVGLVVIRRTSRPDKTHEYPVIIFSPGLSASRLIYANLLENVVSNGFAVVSVDHPYDAAAVEFPDGRVVVGKASMSDIPLATDTRVRDVIFTLNELINNTKSIVPSAFPRQTIARPCSSYRTLTRRRHSSAGNAQRYPFRRGHQLRR